MPVSELLSPSEAAKALHTTAGVLGVWRCHRSRALRFTKIGRKIFYRAEDVQAFIDSGGVPGDEPKPPVAKNRSEKARKTAVARWAKRWAKRKAK
jgi:hypothetical protein